MDITKGHLIFAAIFVVVFLSGMVWVYRADLKRQGKDFKGVWKVLLMVVAAIAIFIYFKNKFMSGL